MSSNAAPAAGDHDLDNMLEIILHGLDEAKAEDVVSIDLRGKSALADMMVIATGRVARHVGAIADRVVKDLKDSGHSRLRMEGEQVGDWVLIDTGDVIVHLFRPEVRAFYNLEKMWSPSRPDEAAPVDARPS